MRRRLWITLGLLLTVPVLLAGIAAIVLVRTLPPSRTLLKLPSLSAPVRISFDSHGVARIIAANERDAAAALGYVHARDRMFQMDLMRRQASGRLSELFGARALRVDRLARVLGERQHAESAYAALPDPLKAMLIAYSAGVNGWIDTHGRMSAPEFLVLGTPAHWTPVDCMLWSETISLWLADNYHTELSRLKLAGTVGPAKMMQLWPLQTNVAAPDSSFPPVKQGFLDWLPSFPASFTLPSEASNAWAVDGHHTTTGAPLLAGDPHLSLNFPAIWYLARIETPQSTLTGATAPGVPFMIIGHNRRVAWTFTTSGIDTQDVFIEHELPGGMYATPDGPKPFETRQEVIHVRGRPDVVFTVRTTRHGPVISDPWPGEPDAKGPVLAVSIAGLQLPSSVPGIFALNHALSVADAGRAAGEMTAPMQNMTVADHANIALFTTGEVPIRKAGDGSVPVDGADGAHDWTGFAHGLALPHFLAPASGTVENANERTAPPDFTPFLGRDFPEATRARRIHARLEAKSVFTPDDFTSMQTDITSAFAQDMLPILRGLKRQDGVTGQAQALLAGWDAQMRGDAPQPLIFNAAMQRFVSDVLAANHVPQADAGIWTQFATWLLTDPAGNAWCGGDCTAALGASLHTATEALARVYGPDPAHWTWCAAHKAVFAHPVLGSVPVIGDYASRRVCVPGDDTTLWRGGDGTLGEFLALHGAAYRGVYDLAALDRSRFVVTPGQSGNFMSPHAWDLLPLWARGETITIPEAADRVTANVRMVP